VVLTETAEFLYKTTDYWHPEHERAIRWDDPALGIHWQLATSPTLSGKDAQGSLLKDAECFV
jgi:dTDP-4-dehydrorhamnose 3,5-epimerase